MTFALGALSRWNSPNPGTPQGGGKDVFVHISVSSEPASAGSMRDGSSNTRRFRIGARVQLEI
jgi:cold shock CspA family protein